MTIFQKKYLGYTLNAMGIFCEILAIYVPILTTLRTMAVNICIGLWGTNTSKAEDIILTMVVFYCWVCVFRQIVQAFVLRG